ncbi:hypothetical protein D3C80_1992430 [compost metagenome]
MTLADVEDTNILVNEFKSIIKSKVNVDTVISSAEKRKNFFDFFFANSECNINVEK